MEALGKPEQRKRSAGFRFFWTDAFVLGLGAVGTWWLFGIARDLALLIPMVVGHFFLFCNVVRLRRKYELFWAIVFCMCMGAWIGFGLLPGWLSVSLPLLLTVVRATQKVFDGFTTTDILTELQFLLAFAVVMIVGSVMLFKFVWQE